MWAVDSGSQEDRIYSSITVERAVNIEAVRESSTAPDRLLRKDLA